MKPLLTAKETKTLVRLAERAVLLKEKLCRARVESGADSLDGLRRRLKEPREPRDPDYAEDEAREDVSLYLEKIAMRRAARERAVPSGFDPRTPSPETAGKRPSDEA